MNAKEKKRKIDSLELLARQIKSLKEILGQRRPILIEFCGTPKAGKSTSISSLNIFLKRNGFKTSIVQEMASVCPVHNKTHPYFNSWTLFSSLAETIKLLTVYGSKVDIIIVDRAIFDSICWFEWLNTNPTINTPYLDDKTYEGFQELLLKRYMWSSLFDLTIVFTAVAEVSLGREYATLLTEKRGSIMNEMVLNSFNDSINRCCEKYRNYFHNIELIDTSRNDANEVGLEVTTKVLHKLSEILIEKIGYFPESIRRILVEGINNYSVIQNIKLEFGVRNQVENSEVVQPVPIAVITNKERTKLLVVKKNYKSTGKGSPETNKYLVYIGGHIREEDKSFNKRETIQILQNTIHREIQEEIGESYYPKESNPFLIYSKSSPKSKKHLAVCFIIEEDLEYKSFRLTSDEFVMKKGKYTKSGHILTPDELFEIEDDFEDWSIQILKHVFSRTFVRKQISLFDDYEF